MFPFFNKDKQNTNINNMNKQEIMTKIEGVKANIKDPAAIAVLRKLQTELQSQTATASADVVEIDTKIIDLLSRIQSSAKRENSASTIVGLIDALELSIDRSEHCPVGGQLSRKEQRMKKAAEKARKNVKKQEQSHVDELQDQIDKLVEENEILKRKHSQLLELNRECPNNAAIISRIAIITNKFKGNEAKIRAVQTVQMGDSSAEVLTDVTNVADAAMAGSAYTDTDVEIAIQNNNDAMDRISNIADRTSRVNDILNQNAMGLGGSMGLDFNPLGEIAPLESNIGSAGLSSSSLGGTQQRGAAAQQSNKYGSFDASRIGSRDMTQDIKRAIKTIEKQIDDYTDKIEDANEEYQDCNRQLAPLIKKWQAASPAEKFVLEPQIDRLKSRRATLINSTNRYRGIMATLSDKLALMQRLDTEQDIASNQNRFAELSGGLFSDMEGLSMFLKDSIAMSNEELERMHMATAVADSETINTQSSSAGFSDLYDAGLGAVDPNKYADLAQELGIC